MYIVQGTRRYEDIARVIGERGDKSPKLAGRLKDQVQPSGSNSSSVLIENRQKKCVSWPYLTVELHPNLLQQNREVDKTPVAQELCL